MREQTIDALTATLGPAASKTDKVIRWISPSGLDVVVQRDGIGDQGIVWVPWPLGDGTCPVNGAVYPPHRGRHSNTYSVPTLARGKAALKVTVNDAPALSDFLVYLKALTNPNTATALPKNNPPEAAPVASSSTRPPATPAQASAESLPEKPTHAIQEVTGLVIKSPWIDLILQGKKTWEIRTRHASKRGRVALIKSKSGLIIGTCRMVDCLGPLSLDQMRDNFEKHQVPTEMMDKYFKTDKTYAWVLAEPTPLERPIPYRHPSGAVIWVKLTQRNVPNAFEELTSMCR